MELSHESHEHLLFFADGESETDELVRCSGCRNDICGASYSCFGCRFHLHKSCAELPLRLEDHPLHPQHPLALLPTEGCFCDACYRISDGFFYGCSLCNFNLHTMCAVYVYKKESIFSETIGGKNLFPYGIHQHLLMLEEEQSTSVDTDDNDCSVCSESISAPFFSCPKSRCSFRLHKFCADLPLILRNNSFHPQHPLFLISQNDEECEICGQASGSSAYVCKPCDFSIHPRCALSNPTDNIEKKGMGEKQIQHFTHQHLLTLLQNKREYAKFERRIRDCSSSEDEGELGGRREKETEECAEIEELNRDCSSSEEEEESVLGIFNFAYCNLCKKEAASFPIYGCQGCAFKFHKSCVELPPQIKSHLHPDHFLFLFARPPRGTARTYCNCCDADISCLNYRCLQCGFMLHGDCFLSLHGSEKLYDHKHCFINIKTFYKLTCQTCGEEGFCSWQCSSCHIMVHRRCADLPSILKLESHDHYLKLTYYLSSAHKCDKMKCRLCLRKVNVDYAAYYCYKYNYAAHLECAPQIGDVVSEEEYQDYQRSLKESQNSTTTSDNNSGVILHFSHQHELTLFDQELEDHKYCEGCVGLIFPPFYGCKQCNFYLHKKCGELVEEKTHRFHRRHPLTLNAGEGICDCSECGNSFNGFMYSCQTCEFKLDLQCADTFWEEKGLQHPCHEHPLFFPYTREDETCKGCGQKQKHVMVCGDEACDYALGYCCLRVPHVAKHRYDDHLLNLSYKNEDEFGEYYCDICEEERHPEAWFYCCSKCDFFAHIKCTVGEFPFIKNGTTYESFSHNHPLTLVEKCQRKTPPLCRSCGKHCYTRVFECCQCNIHAHFSNSCASL